MTFVPSGRCKTFHNSSGTSLVVIKTVLLIHLQSAMYMSEQGVAFILGNIQTSA